MASVAPKAYLNGEIIDFSDAKVSVASSAVLYGLSVYSVFFLKVNDQQKLAFRLPLHYQRLENSTRMIGMDSFADKYSYDEFKSVIRRIVDANAPKEDQFVRVTLHSTQEVAGVRTAGLEAQLSVFLYEAENILPQDSAKLKTSLWRRTADTAIPARAKVNGAYVNSSLAKQEAIEHGADDCLFLNKEGFVSELSAANVFIVRDGILITPDVSSDILEGTTRRSVIELAKEQNLEVQERKVALTEVYNADEVFACGTSAFVSPVVSLDSRLIFNGKPGPITKGFREKLVHIQADRAHSWTEEI